MRWSEVAGYRFGRREILRRDMLAGAAALATVAGLDRLLIAPPARAGVTVEYRRRGFYDKDNQLVAVIISDKKNDPVDVWSDYLFREKDLGPVALDGLQDQAYDLTTTAPVEIDGNPVGLIYLSPRVKSSRSGGYLNIKYTKKAVQEGAGDGGGAGCFIGATPVLMADGSRKAISDIALGDWVLSYDFALRRRVASEVTRLHALHAERRLSLNGVEVTATHPFAVGADRWRQAGELAVGDRLLGDGWREIEAVEPIEGAAEVFNMTVAGPHNYYVADPRSSFFLAHNKGASGDSD